MSLRAASVSSVLIESKALVPGRFIPCSKRVLGLVTRLGRDALARFVAASTTTVSSSSIMPPVLAH